MDVVDFEPERPSQIRTTLTNARQGEDLTGATAIQGYVDRECGDHVAWKIWAADDGSGLIRATVTVNGETKLNAIGQESPWGTNDPVDAMAWIHPRVDDAAGKPDQSVVQFAPGTMNPAHDDRYTVLPVGRHLNL